MEFNIADYVDVERVPGPPHQSAPLSIPYSDQYEELMSIFRGLLNKLELSQRALTLVTVVNSNYKSNPTPWWYRQQIISALGYTPRFELDFITTLLQESPKPYQLWCHRTWIVSRCSEPPDESDLFDLIIPIDLTNFHAWRYFGWYAERFRKWTWL
jgi:protein farnesyltransferase/geranylgeranyltransferase type-1 subunit alpha